MENLDLDLSHYELDDLLNLFHLQHNFSTQDLKDAFKIVASVHPDKSNLPSDYFVFFKKAYSTLLNIHKSKQHSVTFREEHTSKEHEKICQQLSEREDFTEWFNEMYNEHVKVHDDNRDTGYGEWLKENDESDTVCSNVRDMHKHIEERKQKCRELALMNTVNDFSTNGSVNTYDLLREKPVEYASDIFSKLPYEDVRKAHTETVIPVTEEDLKQHRTFNSTDSLIRYRKKQDDTIPQSQDAAQSALNTQKMEQEKQDTQRLYNLLKQDEEYNKANKSWWSKVKRLMHR